MGNGNGNGGFKRKRIDAGEGPAKEVKAKPYGTKFENEGPELSLGSRIKGGLRRAGDAAREGVRRAAAYEPSEETKKSFREVGQTARREFQEASDYYSGGRRSRRGRTADVFGLGSWAAAYGYGETVKEKPRYRETRTSVRRGRVTVTERIPLEERGGSGDPYDTSNFANYLDNFDPFKSQRKGRSRRESYY